MDIETTVPSSSTTTTTAAAITGTGNVHHHHHGEDTIVGLDVGGTLFYFHLSILLNSGSTYFARRFGGNFDAAVAYRDEHGRSVYFIDRSPKRFEYVRDYIVTLNLHLPSDDDLPLRRALREEAEYFGLEGMTERLRVTHVETPNLDNQGILYWLGTRRRTTEYRNPFDIGMVHVGGWIDDTANHSTEAFFNFAATHYTRQNFVAYRPSVKIDGETYRIKHVSFLMSCEHGGARLPVVVDFKFVRIRPTHYSLRASKCRGMEGDWNFEASHDGQHWEVLHASRGDDHLCMGHDIIHGQRTGAETFLQEAMQEYVYSEDEALDAVISFLELHHRHTWELNPPPEQFYRFFRMIGADDIGENTCLHGDGLELYGEIYEE